MFVVWGVFEGESVEFGGRGIELSCERGMVICRVLEKRRVRRGVMLVAMVYSRCDVVNLEKN